MADESVEEVIINVSPTYFVGEEEDEEMEDVEAAVEDAEVAGPSQPRQSRELVEAEEKRRKEEEKAEKHHRRLVKQSYSWALIKMSKHEETADNKKNGKKKVSHNCQLLDREGGKQ